jgi:hypothetical protein
MIIGESADQKLSAPTEIMVPRAPPLNYFATILTIQHLGLADLSSMTE